MCSLHVLMQKVSDSKNKNVFIFMFGNMNPEHKCATVSRLSSSFIHFDIYKGRQLKYNPISKEKNIFYYIFLFFTLYLLNGEI